MTKNTQQKNKPFVAFTGLMGVGKTTRVELLTKRLNLTPLYEQYGDNPYLAKFYQDKKKWAFQSQQWFLEKKLEQLDEVEKLLASPKNHGVIQDMALYQDAAFAHNLFAQQYISEQNWQRYEQMLETRSKQVAKPIIFHLTAEIPTILTRIRKRGREYEKNVDKEYLLGLKKSLMYWLEKICDQVTIVEFGTEGIEHLEDPAYQEEFVTLAKHYLS